MALFRVVGPAQINRQRQPPAGSRIASFGIAGFLEQVKGLRQIKGYGTAGPRTRRYRGLAIWRGQCVRYKT